MSANPNWLPIVISTVALVIGALSLGWNIYRDVILRARVLVSFGVKWISPGNGEDLLEKMILSAVNYGPGKLRFAALVEIKNAPLWRRVFRRVEYFVVTAEWNSPYGTTLPSTIDVSEELKVVFPYDGECFLREPVTDVGIRDTFGRVHWAPRRDIERAVGQFHKDFRNVGGAWRRVAPAK
jgi:hypothetical protein